MERKICITTAVAKRYTTISTQTERTPTATKTTQTCMDPRPLSEKRKFSDASIQVVLCKPTAISETQTEIKVYCEKSTSPEQFGRADKITQVCWPHPRGVKRSYGRDELDEDLEDDVQARKKLKVSPTVECDLLTWDINYFLLNI